MKKKRIDTDDKKYVYIEEISRFIEYRIKRMRLQNLRDVVLYEINGFHKMSNALFFFFSVFWIFYRNTFAKIFFNCMTISNMNYTETSIARSSDKPLSFIKTIRLL